MVRLLRRWKNCICGWRRISSWVDNFAAILDRALAKTFRSLLFPQAGWDFWDILLNSSTGAMWLPDVRFHREYVSSFGYRPVAGNGKMATPAPDSEFPGSTPYFCWWQEWRVARLLLVMPLLPRVQGFYPVALVSTVRLLPDTATALKY